MSNYWAKLGAREELSALRPQLLTSLTNDIARPVMKRRINSSDVLLKGDVLVTQRPTVSYSILVEAGLNAGKPN